MKMNNKRFEIYFFLFAIVLLLLIGIRFGGLTPFNIGICLVLLVLAPILTKILGKKYGTEAEAYSKMQKVEAISEEALTSKITALYTGRGFALEPYESEYPGNHFVCTREGTRNGESFTERGAVLIITTDNVIDISDFNNFLTEMKQRDCTQGMMITTSRFSPEVIDAAKEALVTLWNREDLRDNLNL